MGDKLPTSRTARTNTNTNTTNTIKGAPPQAWGLTKTQRLAQAERELGLTQHGKPLIPALSPTGFSRRGRCARFTSPHMMFSLTPKLTVSWGEFYGDRRPSEVVSEFYEFLDGLNTGQWC